MEISVIVKNLLVILCIDRDGLVGEDGDKYNGVFDIDILRRIKNMIVDDKRNEIEFSNILYIDKKGLR